MLSLSTANADAFAPTPMRPEDGPETLAALRFVPWRFLDPFCEAVVQGVEEAVVNSLVTNRDTAGRDGNRVPALPREQAIALAGWKPPATPEGSAIG